MTNPNTILKQQIQSCTQGNPKDFIENFCKVLDQIFNENGIDLLDNVKCFVDEIVHESFPLVNSRTVLKTLFDKIIMLSDDQILTLLRYILDKLNSRALSFEDQVVFIRQTLSQIYERKKNYSEAAEILEPIPLVNGQKEYPTDFKIEIYLRIAKLYLANGDKEKAEGFINRASMLQSDVKNEQLKIQYKLCYANCMDYKGKYLDAAQRYIEVSNKFFISEEERYEILNNAILCTMLAGAGKHRSRLLAILFKDERCQHLPSFKFLEKMYLEKIIKKNDLELFATMIKPHQQANRSDDTTVLERAIIEHNLLSVSKLYKSITFKELGTLLEVDIVKIDQISNTIVFEQTNSLITFDKQIETICFQVNDVVDSIQQKYPGWIEKSIEMS
ncbi:COP9 signalosome complex subunit 4 [Dermatophagoides pteronyssinus]|uniref:COP9 signalosome complex subunit 4 n=1 Tax=Dermatophagoides pteronyssinus TaxID=6956 RepID=A0ABQ8IW99_DERPT|nr:COP9 signalosome complex subunit 4 [Dermatophagoides pteronyssinus]